MTRSVRSPRSSISSTARRASPARRRCPTSPQCTRSWNGGRSRTSAALTADDLAQVHRLRIRLHEIFRAPDQATAISLVNALVADARTTPRLTDHDGWPLHIHYFTPGARLAEHLAADGAMALAFVIAAGEWHRLATCAAPDCDRVLVDLSRNRSKRYCDARTCGNRLHVAAYRARQKTG